MSEAADRRAAIFWPAFIVFLLAIPVAAVVVLIRAATSDPSFAVEPDYYAKGLAWDIEMAQRRANERLGWTLDVRAGTAAGERALLSVRLSDREGLVVPAQSLRVEAFPVARAHQRETVELRLEEEGNWEATWPLRHGGLWELRFVAETDEDRYTEAVRVELGPAGASS